MFPVSARTGWNDEDSVDLHGFDFACMRSCIKKIAISEPLVDTVNPEQICTKPCQVVLSASGLFRGLERSFGRQSCSCGHEGPGLCLPVVGMEGRD
jgi:hypothetical protein